MNAKSLCEIRQRLRAGDTNLAPALAKLKLDALAELSTGPISVVSKTVTPPSGDKHDYMSQAPYFWPNPDATNGLPYIRRDGERNPEINKITDHRAVDQLSQKTETLALAWYYTGDEAFAAKCTEMLRVFFLDPATRMNPNLRFAQAIPGVNTGRGIGIIESRGLTGVVDAAGLLAGAKSWTDADQLQLQKWFNQYLNWMMESGNGRAEAAARNNHGTFYDIQAVSFALFLGRPNLAADILRTAREKRIAAQIEPDGRQPLELARTRSWSYSQANLDGLIQLARLGENVGVDLWNYQTADGRGIRQALDYLAPFAFGDKTWPYRQLGGWRPRTLFPLLRQAAAKYADPKSQQWLARLPPVNPDSRVNLLP
ncbi:MAG TPA: alginate lyase family protein [Candidatus Acidoferrum sp.]|nr:alginate lyase family protein [Candidatus Acidoferrum sp.]